MTTLERIARAKAITPQATRPVWIGCDGWLRIAHTDDMIQMLIDLGYRTTAQ